MKKPNYKNKEVQEIVQANLTYSRDNSQIPHFHSICSSAERELALICTEGDIRYGEANWCGDEVNVTALKKDAIQHIKNHFNLYISGDRSENHLAKIMWSCMAMIHHDEKCQHHISFIKAK